MEELIIQTEKVTGAVVSKEGEKIAIEALKGVIFAAGGFREEHPTLSSWTRQASDSPMRQEGHDLYKRNQVPAYLVIDGRYRKRYVLASRLMLCIGGIGLRAGDESCNFARTGKKGWALRRPPC